MINWQMRCCSMSKKALGKGIGALIKNIEETTDLDTPGVVSVSIDLLKPNPYQPRKDFQDDKLHELADSIREKGIIQPLIVEDNNDNSYTIIAGERRLRAAKIAELSEVPVIVRSFSKEDKIEIALIENIQRENLSPLEEATGYKNLMEIMNLNQEQVAKRVGKNRSTVANSLRLLKLPLVMHDALHKGELTPGHARAILSVNDSDKKQQLFDKIISKGLSVREAEAEAAGLNTEKADLKGDELAFSDIKKAPELLEIEQKLIDVLGTKVKVVGNTQKGRIEISFFSMDDLDRLIEVLGINGGLY
jgi:ParB family transcriptional regulator, chromosome partitioning protein